MSSPVVNDEFTYAWSWFALHSGQRMQLVNFWLVSVAFLGAAFVQARASNLLAVALGVSAAGAVSSIAFLMLDRRTRDLVQVAERALRMLEDDRSTAGAHRCTRLVHEAHVARSSAVSSYRFVIQGLQAVVAVLFAMAGAYSLLT